VKGLAGVIVGHNRACLNETTVRERSLLGQGLFVFQRNPSPRRRTLGPQAIQARIHSPAGGIMK